MVCKICGGACENTVYLLKNVRKDLQETFEYVKCSECGCLQIREIPENLGDYYDNAIYLSLIHILYIGAGAFIKNRVTIENNSFVGIGSVVTRRVRQGDKVFGNPARKLEWEEA